VLLAKTAVTDEFLGGDGRARAETTAWPRRRRGRDDGVAEMVVHRFVYLAIYRAKRQFTGRNGAIVDCRDDTVLLLLLLELLSILLEALLSSLLFTAALRPHVPNYPILRICDF
jgi:hypothetical protein